MRLGGWGRKLPMLRLGNLGLGHSFPRHKATGYGLIIVGVVIMLLSVPLYVYMAVLGGLIAYAGYVLKRR
ncbi:MAG: hypothetical protein K0R39_2734 [Symbiobacteriaceae bacterium]|nr:hypothetical protein [Symbiobacteriaceae bacterium]